MNRAILIGVILFIACLLSQWITLGLFLIWLGLGLWSVQPGQTGKIKRCRNEED